MRIAFFCDAYKPTHSGVAVSAHTTAEELRKRGHHVVIFAPRYKGHQEVEENVVRFPAFKWFRAKDFSVAWPFVPRASPLAEARFHREEFDIVHSHSPFTLGTTGVRWARHAGIPVVFTFHTLYHRYLHYIPGPSAWIRSGTVLWIRHYCYLCDHIIAPSRPVAQIVAHLQPRTPRSIIQTGVDPASFESGDRERIRGELGIAPDEIVLLYVGRTVREKNIDFLLRALAPLLRGENAPPVRLVIVGGGPFSGALQHLAAELRIAGRVIFTGFVISTETRHYYAAGDIFVFASRTETQGISIAEALTAGLPCVVVGAMGAAEAVTDGIEGFVVPPREDAFRKAVARLLEDEPLRATMAANALLKAPQLSHEANIENLLQLYKRLMKKERVEV